MHPQERQGGDGEGLDREGPGRLDGEARRDEETRTIDRLEHARAIAAIAGGQDNLITRRQLLALGVGRRAVARRVENGRWQRLHRGVYLIGPAPPTATARARAALLACGDGAVISHRTAAELYGLMRVAPGRELHVTVAGRNPGRRPGICVHRTTELAPGAVVTRAGLPLTSPARTLCDIAGSEPVGEVERALAEARFRGLVSDRRLLDVIKRAPTRKGCAVLRMLLRSELESGYTRLGAERMMMKLVRQAGLERPLVNEPLLGYVADFLWTRQRLVVEVDGYQAHRHRAAFESDRRRDQQMVASGYRVVRVTWRQLRDEPLAVIANVAQALAHGA